MQPDRTPELTRLLGERILVLDGAMGTMVQALRLTLPQQNTVAPLQVFRRDDPKSPWTLVASTVAFRLQRDGRGRNLMLFEVESGDIVETLRVRDERRKAEAARGRHPHGLIHPIWRNVPWKPIGEQLAAHEVREFLPLVERAAILDLGLAAGAQRAERRVDEERAFGARLETLHGPAPRPPVPHAGDARVGCVPYRTRDDP